VLANDAIVYYCSIRWVDDSFALVILFHSRLGLAFGNKMFMCQLDHGIKRSF